MGAAVERAQRALSQHGQSVIRRILDSEDFGDWFTPELCEQEQHIRNNPSPGTCQKCESPTATAPECAHFRSDLPASDQSHSIINIASQLLSRLAMRC
jgi:hypothetical protein